MKVSQIRQISNPAQFWTEPDISRICKKRPDFGRSWSRTLVPP